MGLREVEGVLETECSQLGHPGRQRRCCRHVCHSKASPKGRLERQRGGSAKWCENKPLVGARPACKTGPGSGVPPFCVCPHEVKLFNLTTLLAIGTVSSPALRFSCTVLDRACPGDVPRPPRCSSRLFLSAPRNSLANRAAHAVKAVSHREKRVHNSFDQPNKEGYKYIAEQEQRSTRMQRRKPG